MKRINKTKNNLVNVWSLLDDASGSLYNALEAIESMVDLPSELEKNANLIDVSSITSLKNKIEELIHEKEEKD